MADPIINTFSLSWMRRIMDVVRYVEMNIIGSSSGRRRRPIVSDGGAQTEIVVFTVDSYDYQSGVALCTIEYRPYNVGSVTNEIPGYGQIEVQDPAGCYFNEAEADLVGRWGTAVYMTPSESTDPYRFPIWVVTGLCCPEA